MALLISTEPLVAPRASLSSVGASPPPYISQRSELKRIAAETLTVLKRGSYTVQTTRGDVDYDLRRKVHEMRQRTRFYHPGDPKIIRWAASLSSAPASQASRTSNATGSGPLSSYDDDKGEDSDGQRGRGAPVYISVFPGTTLDAVTSLTLIDADASFVGRVGILSSGCATHPGGNLRGGSKGQELSLARASTLYASLISDEAKKLYDLRTLPTINTKHTMSNTPGADPVLNTHGMIYTPGVTIFRDDLGQYVPPLDVDIITCAAVPAQTVRSKYGPSNNTNATNSPSPRPAPTTRSLDARQVEALIQRTMYERMGRVLFLFARRGVRSLVLPAFGTGNFGNSSAVVARLWARLLTAPDAPFARLFDRVVFSVLPGPACDEFERVFGGVASSSQNVDYPYAKPTSSPDDSQQATTVALTSNIDVRDKPKGTNLEHYARALGVSFQRSSRDVDEEGSSQAGKGKGKQRATCEDVDEDEDEDTTD